MNLWDQLVDAVCRPPRDVYMEADLVGGTRATFAFAAQSSKIRKYYREDVELKNSRGQRLVCSHYRPCVVRSKDGRLPCVIYCHTNSGSRRDAEEIVFSLLPHGCTVFALDFGGSGLSDGEWVTLGAHEVYDVEEAVQYLREEGSTSTIGLWGRSMGAVTAILYSCKDPSVAGVVADSPFSKLVDLMLELATNKDQGMSIPKPLARVAMGLMRRSVKRRAGFNIDHVSPVDIAPSSYVPTLFGHGKGDTFIPMHHSERLFLAHGAEMKNFVAFEGDHNSIRPQYWYEQGLSFLLEALRVHELVGTEDEFEELLCNVPPNENNGTVRLHSGHGESNCGQAKGTQDAEETTPLSIPPAHEMRAPWDAQAVSHSSPFLHEEEELQRALELSLEDSSLTTDGPLDEADEERQLEEALRVSLRECSLSLPVEEDTLEAFLQESPIEKKETGSR
eukprot:jgi/Picsp_1/2202/NSC_05666-R1_esterase lipase domain-containing protein